MPNTLAHIGFQGIATRFLDRSVSPHWILLGCIIPDLPWILQRAIRLLDPGIAGFELRLYAIAQASLAFSVLLCAGVALLSSSPRRIFGVLAAGCVLHLLLDASQTKWGNGVHFFAPFSWRDLNWGWYWPESSTTLVLSVTGMAFVAWEWARSRASAEWVRPECWRIAAAVALLALYYAAPPVFAESIRRDNSHYAQVLRPGAERLGRELEVDRIELRGGSPLQVVPYAGEPLNLTGPSIAGPAGTIVSLRGTFIRPSTVEVTAVHRHEPRAREGLSLLGLALVAVFWLRWAREAMRRAPRRRVNAT